MVADIRIKTSFQGHRKRRKLRTLLGPDSTDYLLDLWLRSAVERPDGVLTGMDDLDIALMAGWPGDPASFRECLELAGWLDRDSDGVLVLHGWVEHQSWLAGNAGRVSKARNAALARWTGGQEVQAQHASDVGNGSRSVEKMPEVDSKCARSIPQACSEHAPSIPQACSEHAPSMLRACAEHAASNALLREDIREESSLILTSSQLQKNYPPVLSSESTSPRGGAYSYAPAFEAWWRLYPKKVAKPYAWKCWKKIKGVGADVLIGALERQLAVPNLGHFQRGDKVCLPDPSTWLNKGRWEDEVVAAALSAAAKLRSMAEKEEQ